MSDDDDRPFDDHLRFSVHMLNQKDRTNVRCAFCPASPVKALSSEMLTVPFCEEHFMLAESKVSLEALVRHATWCGEVPPGWIIIGRTAPGEMSVVTINPILAALVTVIMTTIKKGGDITVLAADWHTGMRPH